MGKKIKKYPLDQPRNSVIRQKRILIYQKIESIYQRRKNLKHKKKIQDTNKRANQILEAKRRNEDNQMKKQSTKLHGDEFLKLLQQKSLEQRQQQKEEREAIREALKQLKKEETEEIKKMSKQNNEIINHGRLKLNDEKKKKHDQMFLRQQVSQSNIQTYWSSRLKQFEQIQENKKSEHLKVKSLKEFQLQQMEKEEGEILKRLQYSQNVHQSLQKELNMIIQMKAKDYIKQQEEKQGIDNSSAQGKVVGQPSDRYNKYNNNSSDSQDQSQNFLQNSSKVTEQKLQEAQNSKPNVNEENQKKD
eukprot:TRINITY_DN8684_c0_g1_i1.p1 TRINITY_DN8684_c0_g1~~TRINITY_DN8684_c0_g1_i1.p1  ORF type:complete len:303 (-),score=66.09 TRINITY_DN8684_c0_g1_i1:189-1097(-)